MLRSLSVPVVYGFKTDCGIDSSLPSLFTHAMSMLAHGGALPEAVCSNDPGSDCVPDQEEKQWHFLTTALADEVAPFGGIEVILIGNAAQL